MLRLVFYVCCLMQVNLAGDLTVNDFNMNAPAGRLKPGVADDAGQKLAAFVYDGFGRLIQTQRWDTLGNSELESYYYDGVRRIQELVDDDPNDPNSTIATREYVWGPGYVDEIVCQLDEQGDLLYYLQDANYNVVAVTNDSGDVVFQYAYEPYGGVVAADTFAAAYPDPNKPSINRIGHQGLFFERLYVDPDDPNDPNDTYDTLSDPALSPPTDPNLATPLPGLYQVRNRVLIPNLGRFAQRDMNETALPIITALMTNAQSMEAVISGFALAGHFNDGLNLYTFASSNPITHRDPSGLDDPFAEVDEIIMALTAGRAAAAHHALGQIGNMAQYAAVMAVQATLATLFPPFGMYLALEGAAYAVVDMVQSGPTWENTAALGGSFLGGAAFGGIRAKLGAGGLASVRGALGKVSGGFRWAFGKLAKRYHGMQRSGSGIVKLPVIQQCFVAGTVVLMSSGSYQPINSFCPGDVVASSPAPLDGVGVAVPIADGFDSIEPSEWRLVSFTAHELDGRRFDGCLLRPAEWVRENALSVGVRLNFSQTELSAHGEALITGIEPCPELGPIPRGSRLVTGTFCTTNTKVIDLSVDGLAEPIGTTASHRFWSEDRCGWIAAGDLYINERLRAHGTSMRVTSLVERTAPVTVYNLEIHKEHTYYVSEVDLLVHNSCFLINPKWGHGRLVKELHNGGFPAPKATSSGGGRYYIHPDGTEIRLMPKPNRPPFPNEPPAKFAGPYYYRMRSGPDQSWGPHTSILSH